MTSVFVRTLVCVDSMIRIFSCAAIFLMGLVPYRLRVTDSPDTRRSPTSPPFQLGHFDISSPLIILDKMKPVSKTIDPKCYITECFLYHKKSSVTSYCANDNIF